MVRLLTIGVAAVSAPHVFAATIQRHSEANTTLPSAASQDFWNGLNTPETHLKSILWKSLLKLSDTPAQVPKPSEATQSKTVNVQLFGLQHSGTDLLNALMHMNFPNQITYYQNDGTTVAPGSNTKKGYFVHANVKEMWRIGEQSVLEGAEVKAISIIRNPMAWLSLMKSDPPQELADCVKGEDWLEKPCLYKKPGGPQSNAAGVEYPSVEAIWNQWNDGFEKATEFGFSDKMMIPYESMVRNPKGTLDHISNFLGLKGPTAGWTVPDDKSGQSGRQEVLRFMYKKEYLKDYVDKEIWMACGHLDKSLQRMYGYEDCEKKSSA